MKSFPVLALVAVCGFSTLPASGENKSEDSYMEALKSFDSRGHRLIIYSDLFTQDPIEITVAAAFPIFYISLPTEVPRQFASIHGRMSWDGDNLRLLISVQVERVYALAEGQEDVRSLGVEDLAVILEPGQTLVPVEMGEKVLKISLLPTRK